MSIIIYQGLAVDPTKGGISRMSTVYYDILTRAGYEVWYLSAHTKDRIPLERQLLLEGYSRDEQRESFRQIVSRYNVELIIFQDGCSPYNSCVLPWAKEMDVKIVTVMHSVLKGMYGIDGHPTLSGIKPQFVKTLLNKCINVYFMHKYGRLYREEIRLSDRVIQLSDKFREEITYFTGWKDFSKFVTISNPLTMVGNYIPQSKKQKVVLHVGLMLPAKRQDFLLKIWKIVEKQHNDWTLKIIGDGENRSKLEKLAKRLGLENVCFLGYQSPTKYYEEASIFCLTSAYESFGLVLVEAMAYGCVPMAFNSFETATDIIDESENGKLIKPFNLQIYADELMKLMDNDSCRNKLSVSALDKSKAFDKQKIGEQWIGLVRELLSKSENGKIS